MEDRLSYRAADFLLFSERVYWRLFERLNGDLWPVALVVVCAVAVALAGLARQPMLAVQVLSVLLAVAWSFSGWVFVWQTYAPINLMMPYLAPLFAVQVGLLLYVAIARIVPRPSRAGHALIVMGLFWPLLAPLFGRPLAAAEVIGIAPDPTAVASLGLALMLSCPRWRMVLMILPVLWLVQSALTLWVLSGVEALPPVLALCLALGTAVLTPRRAPPAH